MSSIPSSASRPQVAPVSSTQIQSSIEPPISIGLQNVSNTIQGSTAVQNLISEYHDASDDSGRMKALTKLKNSEHLTKEDIFGELSSSVKFSTDSTAKENFHKIYDSLHGIKTKKWSKAATAYLVGAFLIAAIGIAGAVGISVATGGLGAAPVLAVGIYIAYAAFAGTMVYHAGKTVFKKMGTNASVNQNFERNISQMGNIHQRIQTLSLATVDDDEKKQKLQARIDNLKTRLGKLEKANSPGQDRQIAKEDRQKKMEKRNKEINSLKKDLKNIENDILNSSAVDTTAKTSKAAASHAISDKKEQAEKILEICGATDSGAGISAKKTHQYQYLNDAFKKLMTDKEHEKFIKDFGDFEHLAARLEHNKDKYTIDPADAKKRSTFDFQKEVIKPANGFEDERKKLFKKWMKEVFNMLPPMPSSSSGTV